MKRFLISLLQFDIEWGNIKNNCNKAEELIKQHKGSQLYVLPEMFSTGFCTQPEEYAEENEGYSYHWMQRVAKEQNCAVAGSVLTRIDEMFCNRFYFIDAEGNTTYYDKRHLFSFGGEGKHFKPGNRRVVLEYKGVRILLQICYDLRFPVFSRNLKDYDLILYVASWPDVRIEAWNTLLKARAIENQCYVAAVNRIGEDPSCHYIGGTAFIDPYGKVLAEAQKGAEEVIEGDVNMDLLTQFRNKFPVLEDADHFELINNIEKQK